MLPTESRARRLIRDIGFNQFNGILPEPTDTHTHTERKVEIKRDYMMYFIYFVSDSKRACAPHDGGLRFLKHAFIFGR